MYTVKDTANKIAGSGWPEWRTKNQCLALHFPISGDGKLLFHQRTAEQQVLARHTAKLFRPAAFFGLSDNSLSRLRQAIGLQNGMRLIAQHLSLELTA